MNRLTLALSLALFGTLTACAPDATPPAHDGAASSTSSTADADAEVDDTVHATLTEVASSERRWTGLTVSEDGRLFVNFPRWSDDVPVSVAELVDGEIVPYPNEALQTWSAEDGDAATQFVCVQSVVADGQGSLWILDPASPGFQGVVDGGAKLLRVDLASGDVVRSYRFAEPTIKPTSYLNDVRLDLDAQVAYITDSGAGALIVTDLETGQSRRWLDQHPSTQAEDVLLTIDGDEWRQGGQQPQIHADGIALSEDRAWLYYQALTGRTMYRIPTAALRDADDSADKLAAQVETVATSGAADGLLYAHGGVYISSLENNAILHLDPETGELTTVVQDPRIQWPDTFTLAHAGPYSEASNSEDGQVLFTTALIHKGDNSGVPFRIFRIDAPDSQ